MLSVYMEPVQSIPRHSTAKLLDLKIRKNYLWKSRHPPTSTPIPQHTHTNQITNMGKKMRIASKFSAAKFKLQNNEIM